MKNYFEYLLKHIRATLLGLVFSFFMAFCVVDIINNYRSYYTATFSVENIESFDSEKLLDKEILYEIKESGAGKYDNINIDKMISKNQFSYTKDGNSITIKTAYRYYDVLFFSKINGLTNRAKTFIKALVLEVAKDNKVTFEDPDNIVKINNHINRLNVSFIILAIAFVIEAISSVFFFIYKKDKGENEEEKCDNIEIFDSCLHKNYWKKVFYPIKKVRDVTTLGMLFALMIVCKLIPIPSGFGNLGLSFTYLFFATIALIYGPMYGFVIGIFSDIIGFFINGTGMFNFGYTIQAALTGFIYGLCLYRRKVTFGHVLVSRLLVNFIMNAVMGSFLFVFVFYYSPDMGFAEYIEKVKYYMLLLELPKNTVYLIPQSLLLYAVLKLFIPILYKFRLVDKRVMITRSKHERTEKV